MSAFFFAIDTNFVEMIATNAFVDPYSKISFQSNFQAVKPIYIVNKVLLILKDTLSHVIIYTQIFEWLSIITLISWQKGKTEREIMQEARTIGETNNLFGLSSQNYMIRELYINKLFKVTCVLFSIAVLVTNCLVIISSFKAAFLSRWVIEVMEILVFVCVFNQLIKLTKEENHVMFRKHRLSLVFYFFGSLLFLMVTFVSTFLPWFDTHSNVVRVWYRNNIKGAQMTCMHNKLCYGDSI